MIAEALLNRVRHRNLSLPVLTKKCPLCRGFSDTKRRERRGPGRRLLLVLQDFESGGVSAEQINDHSLFQIGFVHGKLELISIGNGLLADRRDNVSGFHAAACRGGVLFYRDDDYSIGRRGAKLGGEGRGERFDGQAQTA